MEYGDSTVNLQLRVWMDDPKNGLGNVKDAVLLAVWESFHANGIEIAFPQRDLHLKSAVPLIISKDNAQPVAKDSLVVTGNKGGGPPASPSCRLYEPEAVEAIGAYPPACKPMAYNPTGWPPARSGTILRLGEKRPRRKGGIGKAE